MGKSDKNGRGLRARVYWFTQELRGCEGREMVLGLEWGNIFCCKLVVRSKKWWTPKKSWWNRIWGMNRNWDAVNDESDRDQPTFSAVISDYATGLSIWVKYLGKAGTLELCGLFVSKLEEICTVLSDWFLSKCVSIGLMGMRPSTVAERV